MSEEKKPPTAKTGPPPLRVPGNLPTAYANMVRIAHTPSEMMFDFARMLPGDRHAQVVSRVLMSPLGTKLFLRALTENLAKYESAFGEVVIPHKQSLAEFLFRPPQTPDEPSEDNPDGSA